MADLVWSERAFETVLFHLLQLGRYKTLNPKRLRMCQAKP